MSPEIFEDREKAFENKYVRDQERCFKTKAKAVKFFALWAASRLGYKVNASAEYANKVIDIYMRKQGLNDVISFVKKDFDAKSIQMSETDLATRLRCCRDNLRKMTADESE